MPLPIASIKCRGRGRKIKYETINQRLYLVPLLIELLDRNFDNIL